MARGQRMSVPVGYSDRCKHMCIFVPFLLNSGLPGLVKYSNHLSEKVLIMLFRKRKKKINRLNQKLQELVNALWSTAPKCMKWSGPNHFLSDLTRSEKPRCVTIWSLHEMQKDIYLLLKAYLTMNYKRLICQNRMSVRMGLQWNFIFLFVFFSQQASVVQLCQSDHLQLHLHQQ